jgi:hypothetical protein
MREMIYFRKWPLTEISGFEDQTNKKIKTRGFTLSNFNLDELKANWKRIEDIKDLSISPIIRLHLTTCARL